MNALHSIAAMSCFACLAGAAFAQPDGWPMWQRTPTRTGNTTTVGPKTPTIEWSIQFDPLNFNIFYVGSPIMDEHGVIYLCRNRGLTAIDSTAREVLWYFDIADSGDYTPAYSDGLVVFGSPTDRIYCVNAETGQEEWSRPETNRPNLSPVVHDGVVYYTTQRGDLKGRVLADGSLVWGIQHGTSSRSHPSTDTLGVVLSGSWSNTEAWSVSAGTGDQNWVRPLPQRPKSTPAVDLNAGSDGRVYYVSDGGSLTAFERLTGAQVWSVSLGTISWGTAGLCVGHDGTLYAGTFFGSEKKMNAVDPADGSVLWEYPIESTHGNYSPAIVDGDGTIYFTTFESGGDEGRVYALNPDGSELWVKDMPERTASSPMLAPKVLFPED